MTAKERKNFFISKTKKLVLLSGLHNNVEAEPRQTKTIGIGLLRISAGDNDRTET